jgi:hypothetical protein
MNLLQTIKRMRAIGAPILAIQSADQLTTVQTLQAGLNGASPLIQWDCVRGFLALNKAGQAALAGVCRDQDANTFVAPRAALIALQEVAENSIIVLMNAQRMIDDFAVLQGVMNLRDQFKANNRTLILLGPDFRLPVELTADVLTVDEPLPTPEEIKAILKPLWDENQIKYDDKIMSSAVDALRGLASFAVEQAAALAITSDGGVDIPDMWERKRRMIEQTPGLSMERPGVNLDQIGGLEQFKEWARRLFSGPRKPRLIVLIDEIEKAVSGAGGESSQGDTSGTSQDQVLVLLKGMEDHNYTGALNCGPAGGGKTYVVRALAASYGVPLVSRDLGAAKGSLVGESEQKMRAQEKTINAIAGDGGALVFGTCNSIANLSAPLRRRFRAGLYFFDLADADERVTIGALQSKAYGVKDDPAFWRAANGWSGANIRDCCENAYALGCTIKEASAFVVSASSQDPEGVSRLRATAAGRFLSASYPGPYQIPATVAAPAIQTRKINKGEVGN